MQYNSVTALGCVTLTLVSVFLFLELVVTGLRLWCIHIVQRPYRLHDFLIIIALLVSVGHVSVVFLQTMGAGMGHHISDLTTTSRIVLLKSIFVVEFTNTAGLGLIRASVLFFYLDVFRHHKRFLNFVYGALVMTVAIFIAFTVTILTTCRPISQFWYPEQSRHCDNLTAGLIASAAINLIANMVVLFLPLPVVLKLRLTSSDQWKIASIFTIGAILGFIDIARLGTMAAVSVNDMAFDATSPSILSSLEIQVGVINACLPCIDPVLRLCHKYKLHRSNSSTVNLIPSMPSWTRKITFCDFKTNDTTSLTAFPAKCHRDRRPPYSEHDCYFLGRGQSTASTLVQSISKHGKSMPMPPEMSTYGRDAIVVTRDVTVEVKPGTSQNSPV